MRSLRCVSVIVFVLVVWTPGQLLGQEVTFEGKALSQWIQDLKGGEWEDRLVAAWALGEIGPDAAPAVPELLQALADEDAAVRMYAAHALGAIGRSTEPVRAALQNTLNDQNQEVREQAAWALQSLSVAEEAPAPERPVRERAGTEVPTTETPTAEAPGAEAPTAKQACTEEEAQMAVEGLAVRGLSLGLRDAGGNQLNPNVPRDALSLTPEDVARHARLVAAGSYRTLAEVVEYVAAAGATVPATGQPLSVEHLLPDLQRYVNWSFANQQDTRARLGLLLASGPGLTVPQQPPTMTAETRLAPIAALMLVADLVLGAGEAATEQGALPDWLGSATRLACLPGTAFSIDGALPTQPAETLKRVRGLISKVDVVYKLAAHRPLWLHYLDFIVVMYEAGHVYRTVFTTGESDLTLVKKIELSTDNKVAHVAVQTLTDKGTQVAAELYTDPFVYTVTLIGKNNRGGTDDPLFDDADAELELEPTGGRFARAGTRRHRVVGQGPIIGGIGLKVKATKLDNPEKRGAILYASADMPQASWSQVFRSEQLAMSFCGVSASEFEQALGTELTEHLKPASVSCAVIFQPALPDLVVEKAQGFARRFGDREGYLVSTKFTVKNVGKGTLEDAIVWVSIQYEDADQSGEWDGGGAFSNRVTLAPGEQWTLRTPMGYAAKIPRRGSAIADFDEAIEEADEDNNELVYGVRLEGESEEPAPELEEVTEEPAPAAGGRAVVRAASLLDHGVLTGNPNYGGYMLIKTGGAGVSGRCEIWSSSGTLRKHGWKAYRIRGKFTGSITEYNENFKRELEESKDRDEWWVDVGKFRATGQWQGTAYLVEGGEQAISGTITVSGEITLNHLGDYHARGPMRFGYPNEEYLHYFATTGEYEEHGEPE